MYNTNSGGTKTMRKLTAKYDTIYGTSKLLYCWDGCKARILKGQTISPNPVGKGWIHNPCAVKLVADPQAFATVEAEAEAEAEAEVTNTEEPNATVGKGKRAKLNVSKLTGKTEADPVTVELSTLNICGRIITVHKSFERVILSAPQTAAMFAFMNGENNLQIIAGPGCGKSFFLALLTWVAQSMGLSGMVIAFNKSTVDEATAKGVCAPDFEIVTSHSAGASILRESIRGKLGDVNHSKLHFILQGIWPTKNVKVSKAERKQRWANYHLAKKLVTLYKSQTVNTPEDGRNLMSEFGINSNGAKVEAVLQAIPGILATTDLKTAAGNIDFDDMISGPLRLGYTPSPRKLVFVDEVQDFSPAQLKLALSLTGDSGRTVMVGDPRQAIYRWRGAASNGMDTALARLKAHKRGVLRLPLLLTYRCSKASVALCNLLYPQTKEVDKLQAHPDNLDGVFVKVNSDSDWMDKIDHTRAIFSSRCNAPLFVAAMRLLKLGHKVLIRGKDLHKNILAEIDKHNPCRWVNREKVYQDDTAVFLAEYSAYLETERRKLELKGESLPSNITDQYACIVALSDGMDSVKAMKDKIRDIFSEDNKTGAYVFSTIHQIKGLEADWIAIIGGRMPGPWAETEAQIAEEVHIQWVAFSRNKYALLFEDFGPNVGLPKGYGWTPLDEAIANEPGKPTPPKGEDKATEPKAEVIHNVDKVVTEAKVTEPVAKVEQTVKLTIYSTLDVRGRERTEGQDAIRICRLGGGKATRTSRKLGWQYHVVNKANKLIKEWLGNDVKLPKLPTMTRGRKYDSATLDKWETILEAYRALGVAVTAEQKGWERTYVLTVTR